MFFTKCFFSCFTLFLLGQDLGFLIQNTVYAGDEDIVYEIHPELKTWDEANLFCMDNGGTLAYILHYNQHKKLIKDIHDKKLLPKDETSGYWLGGRFRDNSWKWDMTDIKTYDQKYFMPGWQFGEPNRRERNGVKQECIELKYIQGNPLTESLGWNDMWCDEKRGFICQSFGQKDKNR